MLTGDSFSFLLSRRGCFSYSFPFPVHLSQNGTHAGHLIPHGSQQASACRFYFGGDLLARKSKISKWDTPAGLLRLQRLAMQGLTQAEICAAIDVPVRTFRRWCTENEAIAQAVTTGKEVAIAAVENALYKKALSGDLGAMCFFLKNRAPEQWSEHPELRGYDGKVVFVDDIPKTAPPAAEPAGAEAAEAT